MGYVLKRGAEAVEDALAEKVDYSDILKTFKSGSKFAVRVLPDCFVMYKAHSVYKAFYTTPCTKDATGKPDLYDRACDMLYKDAEALEKAGASEDEVKKVRDRAYALKAKKRYLIGFVDLDTKQPMIIDVTENQAKDIIGEIKKKAKKIEKYPFILSKDGNGQATKVSLDIVLYDPDEDDKDPLTPQQRKHFEESAGFQFDFDLFEKVLKVNDEEQQIQDLIRFGFDVSRLGVDLKGADPEGNAKPEDKPKTAEDLGF